jgi:hypothetical protein
MKRTAYSIRVALILAWQVAMVTSVLFFGSSPGCWLLFALAGILMPFIGYLVVGYQIPPFKGGSRVLKAGILTILSVLVTVGGDAGLFSVALRVQRAAGARRAVRGPDFCVCGVTNWSRFSPDEGDFSVLMPFQPTFSCTTNDTAAGRVVSSQYIAESSRVVAFSVVHNRLPINLDIFNKQKLFEAGLKSALGGDGRLLSDTSIELHGYQGRQWKFDRIKRQALITMRAYLVGRELYQVICVMPKRQACSRHAQQFLDSFDLKGKDEE